MPTKSAKKRARRRRLLEAGEKRRSSSRGETPRANIREAVKILREVEGTQGVEWEVILIKAGLSLNGKFYSKEVLKEALSAGLFNDLKSFADHATETELLDRPERSVRDIVGWYEGAKWSDAEGGIVARFKLSAGAEWLRLLMIDAFKRGNPNLIGFSIDALAEGELDDQDGMAVLKVATLREVFSVDVVTKPAAGGRIERLVASSRKRTPESGEGKEGQKLNLEQLLKILEGVNPEAVKELGENPAIEDVRQAIVDAIGYVPDEGEPAGGEGGEGESENPEENDQGGAAGAKGGEGGEGEPEPEAAGAGAGNNGAPAQEAARLKESKKDLAVIREGALAASRMIVEQRLKESQLPEAFRAQIRDRLKDRVVHAGEIKREIEASRRVWAAISKATPTSLGVEVGDAEIDKLGKAMDGLFEGKEVDKVEPFRSLKEAYHHFHPGSDPLVSARAILREAHPMGSILNGRRLRESLQVSDFAQALGDSITRRMQRMYAIPELSGWRRIVSSIVPVSDFRTQRRVRVGGYGNLPAVAERAAYQALTSPGDEEATYAVSKYGGTEDLSIEMIANDDIGSLRAIPQNLGLAAANTLYEFVFDFVKPSNNPTIYDGVALYHASHANLRTVALGAAELSTVRSLMRKQKAYGTSTPLRFIPYLLAVPSELETLSFKLSTSAVEIVSNENATVPNIHRNLEVEVCDYWTDANDWAVVANPAFANTIEVGFWEGREVPELFVSDLPNAGSMFESDVITYKIRHAYAGAVLDYRPFAANQVA